MRTRGWTNNMLGVSMALTGLIVAAMTTTVATGRSAWLFSHIELVLSVLTTLIALFAVYSPASRLAGLHRSQDLMDSLLDESASLDKHIHAAIAPYRSDESVDTVLNYHVKDFLIHNPYDRNVVFLSYNTRWYSQIVVHQVRDRLEQHGFRFFSTADRVDDIDPFEKSLTLCASCRYGIVVLVEAENDTLDATLAGFEFGVMASLGHRVFILVNQNVKKLPDELKRFEHRWFSAWDEIPTVVETLISSSEQHKDAAGEQGTTTSDCEKDDI